ncbi:nuclease PIN [Arthrobacter livingstonensis]|uniref:Nuclease PIN n=1 Tax=Arthrobacter livingstonensis TaxID=670078 RepID=A0A2V5L4Q6_9MICC|nr:nuclease PIN [Arthrobacter livingstonensis]PYI65114.1 nuclease PIN [Arthrobacter livingstonensis]
MKLQFFGKETAGLDTLALMAGKVLAATHTLAELLGARRADFPALAETMRQHEGAATAHFSTLLTTMRTSFINPLPREDLYALGRLLNEASETLTGAAELVELYSLDRIPPRAADQLEILARQAELTVTAMKSLNDLDSLEDYWLEILRLAKRADHTHRVLVAELLEAHSPTSFAKYRSVADQFAAASTRMRAVATQVGSIIVKES